MRFEQPKTYDTFVNDKKALGINAKANELKRSMTNYFSDPDDRYDNRIREANADNNAEMVDAINSIRAQYDAQVPLTQKVFGDKEVVEQKGVDALKQISAELKRQGKGSLVNADGNVLFKNKAGELVDLDQGILKDLWHSTKANKGSIMAGIGGALLAPVTGGSSLLPVMVGGATGSALGAAGDYVGNANDTGQNVDTGTLANLMLENAGLSVLGDGVGYAVAKGGKALINKAGDVINKSKTLKDSLGNEIENVNLKQKAVNILNNTPLLGDVTSANHAPAMGDITRSIKAADAVLSPEELAEKEAYLANNKIELNDINTLGLKAKAYADDYANRTSSPWVKDKVTKAGEYVENKAKGTLDPQITKEQEIALNNAFADPSEMKTIADVIGSDDLVRNKAIKIIDDQAQKRLEAAGIDKNFRINPESFRKLDDTDKAFVSDILGSYVNATKSDYNQVVDAFKQVAGNSPLQIDKKGLDDAINSIVANYAKVEDRDKMRIALDQMAQEGFNINKAFDVRRYLNKAIRNSDYTGEQQARALKEVLDDSMFNSLGDDRGELRALLKEQDEKYAQMKALKDTKIFNKGNDLLSDDFNFDKVGDLINKNNDVWAKTTKGLNKEQIAEVEKAYIRSAIKDELVDLGMNRKGFNPIAVAEKLSDAKFVSDEAKTLQKALFDDAKFRPNTKGIIDAIDAGLKTKSQGGSIATSFSGKVAMAFVARSFERLAKHIPLIGKQAGKKNLYAEAFLKAKTTSDALTDIMKNEAIPIKDRFDLLTQAQSKEIRSLIDDFMAKKEQAKSDLIKMDTAEGNPKNTEIKGENFITKQSPAPKSDLNVKISVDDWVRELGGINANKQIKADLTNLYEKHKELFAKPSDVFRLIKAVKENPTFFYNNNEPNTALIGKILDNGKLGKIGIQKDYDSEYLKLNHATYSSKADKENKRLLRRNEKSHLVGSPTPTQLTLGEATEPTADGAKALLDEKELKVGTPYPTLQRADINQVGPTAGAKSTFSSSDESIIPQKDKNIKTINASPHIASGLLGGTANGADENGNVSPEEFAKGFIYALFGSKFSASAVKRISPELYNSILGLGKKMPQMAKDNPKLLTKIYGSAKSNSINSFAGEKALNASANKLSKAKAMLEKGEDEVKIWQSTGWYKDKDGAWKFEIDDTPAKIKNQNADKLGELLEHKELFKAYPELKDIKIKKMNEKEVGKPGYYDPNKKEIVLRDISDKSTLMHEVQHVIQDVEDFARGGGLAEARSFLRGKEGRKYEQELKSIDKTLSNLLLETQHMRMRYDEIPQSEREYEYAKELFRGINNNEKVYADFSAVRDDWRKKLFEIDKKIRLQDIQDTYKKIHGEAEARNVETRLNLDGKAYPHETFDVNPNETFVSREDGVNFSQKLPELKEKRGIYNVTYNGKFSTPVYKDLEDVEGAVRYAIGNKNKGAKHIEIKHLEDTTKEGYVTKQELLNMGENMRKFIKEYKEPFINDRKARLYEWEDKDGVRFRLVINDIKDKNGGSGIHSAITSTSANNDIITFYSDRNLKEPMKFENPKLKLLDAIDNSSDKVGAVEKILLNKHISDGVKAKAVNRLTKNKISQGVKTNYISTKNSNNN
ncbi:LPD23 domain-containing protein [Campylobacter concisus]|uniref:LPD23 domain-containing protein n=1 Tax=Campylobacter concisus TaxID=199 RepID=UPI000D319B94|nr:LPD23 domain-containing protein [Campylobacter concisus]